MSTNIGLVIIRMKEAGDEGTKAATGYDACACGDTTLNSPPKSGARTHYDSNYDNFRQNVYEEVRREAFGEDIGQNSWLTADEQDRFLRWLALSPGKVLLDVGCGAGGPALRIAARTGCSVIGIDAHEQAVATGSQLARDRGLASTVEFRAL